MRARVRAVSPPARGPQSPLPYPEPTANEPRTLHGDPLTAGSADDSLRVDSALATVRDMSWTPPPVGSRATWTRRITADDVELYAQITGDRNPLHFDPAFAGRTRFGALVAQGGLATGLFNALVAMELPGAGSVFLHQEWDYPAPVFVGDTVTAEAEVIEARADKPLTRLRCVARRQDGTEVLRGECLVYTMLP
jgi:acyl dehydratase